MDRQALFDTLTLRLSERTARRDVLRLVGRFLVAVVVFGAVPWPGREVAASQLVKGCKLPGQKCSGKNNCCARKCTGQHRCGCIKKGGHPTVKTPLGPTPVKALCCTNKLNKLKGTCK